MDMLRSGGNSRARVPERIILPRLCDVVGGLQELWACRDEVEAEAVYCRTTRRTTASKSLAQIYSRRILPLRHMCCRKAKLPGALPQGGESDTVQSHAIWIQGCPTHHGAFIGSSRPHVAGTTCWGARNGPDLHG